MKLKKKFKVILIAVIVVIIICFGLVIASKVLSSNKTVKEPKVLNEIKDYGYVLKDNKSKKYQELFKDLVKILDKKEISYEEYASKLAEMFIVDFYSLEDKTAKTDVGGVDIVHPDVLSNFLENAENTYYKYVESNIYNNRKQNLPVVNNVVIDSIEQTTYAYNGTTDQEAYYVKVTWDYTDEDFDNYQKSAGLVFVHVDKKLYLVELK